MEQDGAWTTEQLAELERTRELRITAQRIDGSTPEPVPIWVVVDGDAVVVRTWHPRRTGWYGAATRTGRARIDVRGAAIDVVVEPAAPERAAAVDDAYRRKYGDDGARSMTTADAVASSLRLTPR